MDAPLIRRSVGKDGFTFIEVMVVLALLAVIASLASPSMGGYLNRTEVNSAMNQLVGDIDYTRMMAIESGQGAVLQIQNSTTYMISRPVASGGISTRVVDLSADYPGLVLVPLGNLSFPITLFFDSRGLLRPPADPSDSPAGAVEVRQDGQAGSIRILASGRAFREN